MRQLTDQRSHVRTDVSASFESPLFTRSHMACVPTNTASLSAGQLRKA